MVEGGELLRYGYAVGLITWPNPLERIESKLELMQMKVFSFMEMHVNTKTWL